MQHAQVESPPVPVIERRSLISTGTAAGVAACHRTTILRAIQRGELEAVRLGQRGDYRIPPEALLAWLHPDTKEDR